MKHNVPESMAGIMAERSNMALSKNTKSNYQTVKNNIDRCEEAMDCDLSFPWETGKTLNFLAFLLFSREVKAKTASCQLSGVRMAHLELGWDCPVLRPPIVELLLRGTEHWETVSAHLSPKPVRAPVTISLMMAMKRKLFESQWTLKQKSLFWSVSTLLWAGSLRVHEALSRTKTQFDPQTTLLCRDIEMDFQWNLSTVRLHLTKTPFNR